MALKDFLDYVKWEFEQRTSYHDYHDYHDYDNYGNYSDYSDYAERQRRKLVSLRSDTESAARELSSYKRFTVNHELSSQNLKDSYAMRVSESAMNDDVQNRIRGQIEQDESRETSQLTRELAAIDELLSKISSLERVS